MSKVTFRIKELVRNEPCLGRSGTQGSKIIRFQTWQGHHHAEQSQSSHDNKLLSMLLHADIYLETLKTLICLGKSKISCFSWELSSPIWSEHWIMQVPSHLLRNTSKWYKKILSHRWIAILTSSNLQQMVRCQTVLGPGQTASVYRDPFISTSIANMWNTRYSEIHQSKSHRITEC